MRKSIAIIAAVCAVFAFTGMAMAENRVEVKVTSEPISYQAECDKAGGFSLEFDSNTTIAVGDQITIDLPFTSPTDFVTICKDIDLLISMDGLAGVPTVALATPFTAAALVGEATSPLQYLDDTSDASAADLAQGAGGGIYFRIRGSVDTQRITIDVLGPVDGSLTVGPSPGDKLVLVFLDQKTNTDFVVPGIYADADATGVKNGVYAPATAGDNTLCIDVSGWTQATVNGNMDSMLDKYTFIPSNPQIAHVAASSSFSFASCEKGGVGRVNCGVKGGQGGVDTCTAFDFEEIAGYVAFTHSATNRVIIQSNNPFPNVQYQVRLDILVNGIGGDNGVYWSNELVRASGYDASPCLENVEAMPVLGALANYIYRDGANIVMGGAANANIEPPHVGECDVADTADAVSVTTNAGVVLTAATNDFIMINLPALNYDIDDITADDVVTVQVSLIKAPCGTIFSQPVNVGTMCAEETVPVLTSNTVVFPYFTAMANDNWWDGLVITNLSAAEGNFTAMVYEQDGDVGAFTGVIDPNSLYQGTLANALAGATLVVNTGSGVLGDSLCYILVCTDFTADGFAFMGSLSTNSLMANESMGYVPRVDYYSDGDSLPFCDNLNVVPGDVPAL